MIQSSFRTKLLLLFLAVVILTLSSTIWAVLRATNNSVESLVEQELSVVQRVFLSLLENERKQLRMRAEILAGDFAFKRAVATGEEATLVTALANHGERLDADLILLLGEAKNVMLSTHQTQNLMEILSSSLAKSNPRSINATTIVENAPFQLVLVPVMAPDLIGWVGLGLEIDTALLGRLRELTGADITLIYGEGVQVNRQSTLPASQLPLTAQGDDVAAAMDDAIKQLEARNWINEEIALGGNGTGELYAILSSSIDTALASYEPLRYQMLLIAALALALAALTAMFIARWVTQPIYRLMSAATEIADGDYTKLVELESNDEFSQLGEALNLMQHAVAEREARISHQAQHDLVTQLPNRNYIQSRFASHIKDNPPGAPFGLCLLQLSNLTQLTDLYGSDFSDTALRAVAASLSNNLRRGDLAARVADNQILLFLDGLDHTGVAKVVENLQAQFSLPLDIRGVPVNAELWLGFVLCPAHGSDFDDVLRRAQIALSYAKLSSQPHAIYQIGQDETHLRQIQVANRLQVAVENSAFNLLYQPKYNLQTCRVEQVEALMRWTDSELGQVFPDEFIPLAEQTGIISSISEIVIETAIAQVLRWRERGIELTVCINLSGIDVLKREFVQQAIASLHASGLPETAMVMEITETAMVSDMSQAIENLRLFEEAGIAMSIDDFGTGYSSLAQLKALPVKELKIDKSLIENLDTDDDDLLIVRSTVEMAHYLGLKVVAEGVENLHILKLLHAMECEAIQGYYLARPMSGSDLEAWLEEPPEHVTAICREIDADK